MLLKKDANVNLIDSKRKTALMYATENQHKNIVDMLQKKMNKCTIPIYI
jgi:ankyrin repeat protein